MALDLTSQFRRYHAPLPNIHVCAVFDSEGISIKSSRSHTELLNVFVQIVGCSAGNTESAVRVQHEGEDKAGI